MFWLPILSLLAMGSPGSDSQPVVSQPRLASVSPGEMVTLSCVLSSGFGVSDRHISWYQQKPEIPPRYLLRYYSDSDKHQGSGVPARFSGSKDTSSNTAYLNIAESSAEDEADYYCLTHHGSGSSFQYIFGGGTHLSVLGQPASPPTVNLYSPSRQQRATESKATMVCLIQNFNPGVVQVTWEVDGATITKGVDTTKPTKSNDKYMASSYLKMDASEWERHESYTCKVGHEGTEYTKTITRSQCP